MMRRKRGLLALLTALMLVLAACSGDTGTTDDTTGPDDTTTTAAGSDTTAASDTTTTTAGEEEPMDDLAGTRVTLFGPETDAEGEAIQTALDTFAEETGIEIVYTGARDFSDQINAQASGGNPPDIAIIPQPGKIADFADLGFILPLPDDVTASVEEVWEAGYLQYGSVDGVQYAVPTKNDLKSLVWYSPTRFAENGYEIPATFDEFLALIDTMIADGLTPLCVGIESGPATGWPFTDWVEDMTLRFADGDFYDQWVAHEVPFNNETHLEIWQQIIDIWNTPGAVYASGGSIASTFFGDNGAPLANGDCEMHRQANFFAAFLPEGTEVGPEGDIDAFYFPAQTADEKPVLFAGTNAVAFRDAPEVWAVMEFLGSPDYPNARVPAQGGGFLSGVQGQNLDMYSPFERGLIEILSGATTARFDASDLMPAAVGSGTFWTAATDVTTGSKTVQEALDQVEAEWPEG
ncbi:MAG: ABC transporter substrate-binding protein [Acidimicrobiia bacterium]